MTMDGNDDSGEEQSASDRFEALAEMTDDGVVTIDTSGIIRSFNAAAEEIFGYDREEVVGENVSMLMPQPHADRHDDYIARYLETGDPHIIGYGREVEGQSKDGETFPLELSVREFEAEGDRWFVGFVRDLSRERRLQREVRQIQKMEAVGTLTTGVAHDFNNVLMGISGHAQMAVGKLDEDHPVREHLKGIESAVVRGAGLTNRLLAFTRRENGEGRAVWVDEVVEDLRDLFRPLVSDQVDLELSLGADGIRIECDPGHLDQVLLNLVVNARDASDPGDEVRVETDVREVERFRPVEVGQLEPGRYARLSVVDEGTGMEAETLEHVFEPFFSTKPVGEGTGLGLATVFGIVRQWDGAIEVETEPGEGTSFRVYFEVLDSVRTEDRETEREARHRSEPGERGRVLLLDDAAPVREVLTEYLESGGYDPVPATDLGDATERSRGRTLDAAVVDLTFADGDGRGVADRLRADHPNLALVFISGHAEPAANDELLDVGNDVLQKPFSEETLLAALDEALEEQRVRHEIEPSSEPTAYPTILVVEDNDLAREATQQLLEGEGHPTVGAEDGEEAMAIARDREDGFGAAVVDLTLPNGSGIEVVDHLRGEFEELPVVLVSGVDAEAPEVAAAVEHPGTTFLQKPVDIDRLMASLDSIAEGD